ncbi:C-type lectin 37Da-like [Drosophila takahashii]|uniref:C-type lectin 37Da-like n=1 Tax=Drosophila takahashii TaxID=29030 RepID=UPI001CF84241|nr:C-type lectin 37Da-like [Drosophila takahashii]
MLWPKLVCFALVALAFGQLYQVASEESIAVCPTNFTQLADKCYLLDDSWKNFYESDRHCRSLNAGLLSIKNAIELKALNDWLPVVAPYQPEYWTSGNKLGQTGNDYYWQSTGEQALFLPWATGQPTPASGDCLSFLASVSMTPEGTTLSAHRLSVRNCTKWAAHICEAPLQYFKTQLCLNTTAFFEAKVPV